MSFALAYWVVVAMIGFTAAIASLNIGQGVGEYLRREHPELVGAYRGELLRDLLLVAGLFCNLATGLLAVVSLSHTSGPLALLTLLGVLGGATTLSAFAVLNWRLRSKGT